MSEGVCCSLEPEVVVFNWHWTVSRSLQFLRLPWSRAPLGWVAFYLRILVIRVLPRPDVVWKCTGVHLCRWKHQGYCGKVYRCVSVWVKAPRTLWESVQVCTCVGESTKDIVGKCTGVRLCGWKHQGYCGKVYRCTSVWVKAPRTLWESVQVYICGWKLQCITLTNQQKTKMSGSLNLIALLLFICSTFFFHMSYKHIVFVRLASWFNLFKHVNIVEQISV